MIVAVTPQCKTAKAIIQAGNLQSIPLSQEEHASYLRRSLIYHVPAVDTYKLRGRCRTGCQTPAPAPGVMQAWGRSCCLRGCFRWLSIVPGGHEECPCERARNTHNQFQNSKMGSKMSVHTVPYFSREMSAFYLVSFKERYLDFVEYLLLLQITFACYFVGSPLAHVDM